MLRAVPASVRTPLGLLVIIEASTLASPLAMVDAVAPAGTQTEAFAWLATATAIGASLGAAGAGAVA